MKLVIPIFQTEFDALQLLVKRLYKIPPGGDFGDFFLATFGGVIRMKLVIPIFHSEFDALDLLFRKFYKIPPSGDFGDFWWLLLVTEDL